MTSAKDLDIRGKGLNIGESIDDKIEDLLKNKYFLEEIVPLIYKSYCDSKWTKPLIKADKGLDEFEEFSFRCSEGKVN